jgi:hypothetical protein
MFGWESVAGVVRLCKERDLTSKGGWWGGIGGMGGF